MRHAIALLLVLIALAIAMTPAEAHFKLLAPQSWLMENDLGDPQKAGPCGGTSANAGTPSNVVNKAKGGEKLPLKLQETVFHPGPSRVALAVNSAALPPGPEATAK